MKRIPIVLLFSIFNLISSNAQTPVFKMWDYRYGSTSSEVMTDLIRTSDGGFIIAGMSDGSASGNKTQPSYGSFDYWIVKLDSSGIMMWDKVLGGSSSEYMTCIHQTDDGGYILGGASTSGISGNKTQPVWGNSDYWIIKLDAAGNIQWDKDF